MRHLAIVPEAPDVRHCGRVAGEAKRSSAISQQTLAGLLAGAGIVSVMDSPPTVSEDNRESLRARAARERAAVRSRVANARLAVIGCVTAATCGLAVYVGTAAAGASSSSQHSAPTSAVRSLFGGGSRDDGGGSFGDSAASAPGAASGQGDAVSGGS